MNLIKHTFSGVLFSILFCSKLLGDSFSVALIGDLPYLDTNLPNFDKMKNHIDSSKVDFVIHDGDFKSGSSPCSNEVLIDRHKLLNSFEKPLIFLPGDNEWTDCHRKKAGEYDPIERLSYLRKLFYKDEYSQGQNKIKLTRQKDIVANTSYPENFTLLHKSILFAGVHVVGSNNNLGRNLENDIEFKNRAKANSIWLKNIFSKLEDKNSKALVLTIHANPLFEKADINKMGFVEFLNQLEDYVKSTSKPILFVHGDSHYFQINKPLPMQKGNKKRFPRLAHFTRVETFGSPDVHWLELEINPNQSQPFTAHQKLISK